MQQPNLLDTAHNSMVAPELTLVWNNFFFVSFLLHVLSLYSFLHFPDIKSCINMCRCKRHKVTVVPCMCQNELGVRCNARMCCCCCCYKNRELHITPPLISAPQLNDNTERQ